jgi:hypothetical protein
MKLSVRAIQPRRCAEQHENGSHTLDLNVLGLGDGLIADELRGHAMRAALIALLLTVASQSGAECGNQHDNDW